MQPKQQRDAQQSSPQSTRLRFSLVGPGRVGQSMAAWMLAEGAKLVAIAGGGLQGQAFADQQKAEWFSPEGLKTTGQDLVLVAVPDQALETVADALTSQSQARVVLHTAGSVDAEVLAPLRSSTTAIGSLHPLMAFPQVLDNPENVKGTFFAVDGDSRALELARHLVDSWHSRCFELGGDRRVLYHLAARLAAGGVVTMLAAAEDIAQRLSLPPEANAGFLALARGALDQITSLGSAPQAITGPLARKDEATLKKQQQALGHFLPALSPVVEALDEETRRQLERLL